MWLRIAKQVSPWLGFFTGRNVTLKGSGISTVITWLPRVKLETNGVPGSVPTSCKGLLGLMLTAPRHMFAEFSGRTQRSLGCLPAFSITPIAVQSAECMGCGRKMARFCRYIIQKWVPEFNELGRKGKDNVAAAPNQLWRHYDVWGSGDL